MDAFVGGDDAFGLGSLAGSWAAEDEDDSMVVTGEGGGVDVREAAEGEGRGGGA